MSDVITIKEISGFSAVTGHFGHKIFRHGCWRHFAHLWMKSRDTSDSGQFRWDFSIAPMDTVPLCALVSPQFSIGVLDGVTNLQSRERGGRRGSRMVPSERALVSSYRPSIVTFPLSLLVSEISPLLCSNPIPLVSPKFLNVPCE